MKPLHIKIFLPAMLSCLLYSAGTTAQGYGGSPESQGSLQWTYTWSSPSQSDRSLQVVFASKSPERWLVSCWDWTVY